MFTVEFLGPDDIVLVGTAPDLTEAIRFATEYLIDLTEGEETIKHETDKRTGVTTVGVETNSGRIARSYRIEIQKETLH